MARPPANPAIYGLVAEFDRAEALKEAVRRTREAGYRRFEAYSPFPIDGLAELEGFHEPWVPLATLLGGLAGAAIGYLMQVYTNLDFPIRIGGRPLIAPPAFALITVEILFLMATIASVVVMFAMNGLPRLHHPLFDVEDFGLASLDRFFLVIEAADAQAHDDTRGFLQNLGAIRIESAPAAGAPT